MTLIKEDESTGVRLVIEPRTFQYPIAQVKCATCGKIEELVETKDIDLLDENYFLSSKPFGLGGLIEILLAKLDYYGWKEFEFKQSDPKSKKNRSKLLKKWICPGCKN